MTQYVAYIDESSIAFPPGSRVYRVCAAIVDTDDADDILGRLTSLWSPGSKKLHWRDESDKRRRQMVAMVAGIGSSHVIISYRSEQSSGTKQERARRKCLEQIYYELAERGILAAVLESRDAVQDSRDIQHIAALQGAGQATGLRIWHRPGRDEPLLWIPDIVLGAFNAAAAGDGSFWEPVRDQMLLHRFAPGSATM